MRTSPDGSCEAMSTRALLRLYADILSELIRRGVVRSRNAPAGDLAEEIVRVAFAGSLAPPSEKSWDVLSTVNRPGIDGGSEPTKGWGHACTEEVPAGAA